MKKALLSLLFSAFATGAYAQVDFGQLSGTVSDPTGAVVAGAQINIHNDANGFDRSQQSSGSGIYTFDGLPIGSYKETVTEPGFATYTTQVIINVGGRATVDAKLGTSSTSTQIEVSSSDESTQVNTTNSEISQVIDPHQVLDLPSLTRNPYDFVVLSGNTSQDPGGTTARGVGAALSGQRAAGTEVLLDGIENADNYDAAVGQAIPLDSVDEYRIITNGFDAQYGRAAGGVVNVATKSGSNKFHGSVYEFNRISALAANTYYEDQQNFNNHLAGLPYNPSDHFTRNQFGYSVGGPILHDRFFFFSNTEWNRIRSSGSATYEIPTPSFIAASAPNTQAFFANFGTIASSTRVGATIPVPGFAANPLEQVTVSAPINAGAGSPVNLWTTLNRLDYTLNSKISMYFRGGNLSDNYTAGYNSLSPYNGFNTGQSDFNQSYLWNMTYAIKPSVISTSKVSFSRLNLSQPINGTSLIPGAYLNASNGASSDSSTGIDIALPGYLPTSPGNALPFGGPSNTYQFLENVSLTIKTHTLNFGGEFFQLRDNRTFGASENGTQLVAKSGTAFGTALATLQAGNIYSFAIAVNPQGHYPCFRNVDGSLATTAACTISLPATSPSFTRENTFNDGSWYAEDSWKATPRLTINYGIRWEYYGVQHNHDPNLESNFFLGSGDNLAQQVANGQVLTTPNSPYGGLTKKNLNNYAPRVGFAFDPTGTGKWAIRGGYGISYERDFGNVTYNVIQNPPNYAGVTLTSTASATNPTGSQYTLATTNFGPFAGSGSVGLPPSSLRALQQNEPTAYTHLFNLSVEHEVAPNDLVSIEYSGAHGVHQYAIAGLNGEGYGTFNGDPNFNDYAGNRLNHQYTGINYREANGDSQYEAANVRFNANNLQKYGLTLSVNYTFSHAMDDLSSTFSEGYNNFNLGYLDPYNPRLDYGNADYDVRHRVAIGGVYEPSFLEFKKNAIAHAVFGGLEVAPIATLRSGTPFTIYDCTNELNACPRIVGAPGLKFHGSPTPNGTGTYNYIDIPTASANPFVNSQGFSDFPDNLGGYQNSGLSRNQFYGPDNYQFDAGVYKNIHLGRSEQYTVQLRGEFYNILNHHNFYPIVTTADYAEESTVTAYKGTSPATNGDSPSSADERRNVQLALRFQF